MDNTLYLVIKTLGGFYAYIVLLRFLLQVTHADFYNPISQSVAKFTSAPIAPFRRLLPKVAGIDFSALVLGYLVYVVMFLLILLISGQMNIVALLVIALANTAYALLNIIFWASVGSVIISWIAPNSHHPAPQLILQLTEPLFKLVRKVIPPIAGLDLSPIFIFLAIQIIQHPLSRYVW